jgi:hypothetical protein
MVDFLRVPFAGRDAQLDHIVDLVSGCSVCRWAIGHMTKRNNINVIYGVNGRITSVGALQE